MAISTVQKKTPPRFLLAKLMTNERLSKSAQKQLLQDVLH